MEKSPKYPDTNSYFITIFQKSHLSEVLKANVSGEADKTVGFLNTIDRIIPTGRYNRTNVSSRAGDQVLWVKSLKVNQRRVPPSEVERSLHRQDNGFQPGERWKGVNWVEEGFSIHPKCQCIFLQTLARDQWTLKCS